VQPRRKFNGSRATRATVRAIVDGAPSHEPAAYEISPQADISYYSPAQLKTIAQAHNLLATQNYAQAEEVLRDAIFDNPEYPVFYNYLLVSLLALEKNKEADELIEQTYTLFPAYFFARTNLAMKRAREDRTSEARKLMKPLELLTKMHLIEFRSFVLAQMEIVTHDFDESSHSLDKWIKVIMRTDPTFPQLARYQEKLKLMRMLEARRGPVIHRQS
jgi:tetratricopeptide (TPR) repeat protein